MPAAASNSGSTVNEPGYSKQQSLTVARCNFACNISISHAPIPPRTRHHALPTTPVSPLAPEPLSEHAKAKQQLPKRRSRSLPTPAATEANNEHERPRTIASRIANKAIGTRSTPHHNGFASRLPLCRRRWTAVPDQKNATSSKCRRRWGITTIVRGALRKPS